ASFRRHPAVFFGMRGVVQEVNDRRPTNGLRIVDASVFQSSMMLQLRHARVRELQHVVLRAEVQASRRTRLDAGGLQTLTYTVGAERAFVDFFRRRIELGN